jgi:hypothetical protein
MGTITIKAPTIFAQAGVVRVSTDLVIADQQKTLWFECDASHTDKLSPEPCDGFLVSVLVVALRRGDDIVVEGPLSSRLYYSLTHYYIELLKNLIPNTRNIAIEAKILTRKNWGGSGVFTGFSAGVDSFCTIIEHSQGRVPSEYQITHLLFHNVGSHGQTKDDTKIFQDRYLRLHSHAQNLKLPLIAVNSNLDAIIKMDFQLTHTLRNVAVALMFQTTCAKYLYSSAVHYRDIHVGETYDMGYADAIGVGLLSTETTECISSGSQHTRFRKTEIISSAEVTYTALDVCTAPAVAAMAKRTNCSRCWKCLRTELTLEVIGALAKYDGVFHLDTYRKFRWLHICNVLSSRQPLLKEIKASFDKYEFKIPLSALVVARLVPNKVIDLMQRVWAWALTDNPFLLCWRAVRYAVRHGMKRVG